jgi:nitroreductase
MKGPLDAAALDQLFRQARSYNQFTDRPVDDDTLRQLYELLKWGPTSMNTQPGRFLFVRSAAEKQKLLPALSPGNVEKTLHAPVTVIIAADSRFHEHLPTQFKAYEAKPLFDANPALTATTAARNSALQGAYLMLAARALGLDCGAMSGFDATKLNEAFFPDGRWQVNFLVNLGYGAEGGYHPRGPRLPFDEVAKIL